MPGSTEAASPLVSADASGLTIRQIETVLVRVPLSREFKGSHYRMTHRSTMITRVVTDEGVVGEAYTGDEDAGLTSIAAIVQSEIAPAIVGLSALSPERCWAASYPSTYDILRDRRLGLVAVAAVDAAIWDTIGRALKQPLWRLWGGFRDSLPMIAIGGYYGEPLGTIEDEMAYYQEAGLAGIKFKVGGETPEVDAERVTRAHQAARDGFAILLDANQGYTVPQAISLLERIEGIPIRWFEEPVRWHNDKRALRDVRLRTSVPICAGQSEFSPSGCRDLMEHAAIDVCNFDASWSGGPTAWRRTAAIAHAYDVEMAHHEEPQIASHLLASQPHGTFVECFHPERDPIWWNLVANRPMVVDGEMALPDRPGFGWDLDWDYVERHRLYP